jgi:hypothetical protein
MASYLVETYSPIDPDELAAAVKRIQAVARAMSRQGVQVRHVKAILVPGDETCFHLVEAPSMAALDELIRRARLINTRVAEAVE